MKLKGDDMKNLIDARRTAEAHNCFVVNKHDAFLLYRRLPHQTRGTFVGRAKSTRALLDLVKRAAQTTKEHAA